MIGCGTFGARRAKICVFFNLVIIVGVVAFKLLKAFFLSKNVFDVNAVWVEKQQCVLLLDDF